MHRQALIKDNGKGDPTELPKAICLAGSTMTLAMTLAMMAMMTMMTMMTMMMMMMMTMVTMAMMTMM